jgi:hypothetical protein
MVYRELAIKLVFPGYRAAAIDQERVGLNHRAIQICIWPLPAVRHGVRGWARVAAGG